MVTINKLDSSAFREQGDFELKGLSTDTKPTEIGGRTVGVNSLFLEVDTLDIYYFDGTSWNKAGGE